MKSIQRAAAAAALTAATIAGIVAAKKMREAYKLQLENCTEHPLDLVIGTDVADEALSVQGLVPGEKRMIDLTALPLGDHNSVYIRFPETADHGSYKRTLLYDIDEGIHPMHGMIVDYGHGNLDVKLVRRP